MTRFAAIAAIALVAAAVAVPQTIRAQNDDASDTYRQLDLFGEVFERVRAEYVEDVTDQELVEAAIDGMLTSLDPHSSYLNAETFEDMQVQTRGSFGGLGIEVTMENGFVLVVSPIDDTPADRAGLESGDYITHLDGEPVQGLSLNEAVDQMRGPVGSDLTVTILRGDQDPFDVTITRDIITIQSVRSRVEDNVGYIRVTSFTEQTQSGVEEAIDEIEAELGDAVIGYVLDLRNNPGGLLDQAIAVSDAFLEQGEIVSTRRRNPEDAQRYNAREGDLITGKPLVVLINGGSASASEIVAGALQDHGRAIVLGTRSFGKGSVQTIVPLPGHGAMRLTTARYYTPAGTSIQAEGIVPDIIVPPARIEEIEVRGRREADLRGALDNGPEGEVETDMPGIDESGAADEGAVDEGADADAEGETDGGADGDTGAEAGDAEEEVDYQLTRALDLLRGLALFQERSMQ
ncbi:MAG: PDZ domain-containing protein [Alphaproteobacteria bacterium]|nr:PDZ domain-containing protein [Alphaproteobacteria bacterium]